MKRTGVLLVLLLVLAAGLSAHDKGDLVLNIETQLGGNYPDLGLIFHNHMFPGLDFGVRGVVSYHLTSFFSINAGLGYGLNYHIFADLYEKDNDAHGIIGPQGPEAILLWIFFFPIMYVINYGYNIMVSIANTRADVTNDYFASYLTIPFGFNFHRRTFTIGAGLTGNIPVYGSGNLRKPGIDFGPSYGNTSDNDKVFQVFTFKLLPYLGWYIDIGFDLSARERKPRKFGMAFRLASSFADEIAEPSDPGFKADIKPYRFKFVTASLIFKIGGFRLANLPLGSNKQQPEPEPENAATEEDI